MTQALLSAGHSCRQNVDCDNRGGKIGHVRIEPDVFRDQSHQVSRYDRFINTDRAQPGIKSPQGLVVVPADLSATGGDAIHDTPDEASAKSPSDGIVFMGAHTVQPVSIASFGHTWPGCERSYQSNPEHAFQNDAPFRVAQGGIV